METVLAQGLPPAVRAALDVERRRVEAEAARARAHRMAMRIWRGKLRGGTSANAQVAYQWAVARDAIRQREREERTKGVAVTALRPPRPRLRPYVRPENRRNPSATVRLPPEIEDAAVDLETVRDLAAKAFATDREAEAAEG